MFAKDSGSTAMAQQEPGATKFHHGGCKQRLKSAIPAFPPKKNFQPKKKKKKQSAAHLARTDLFFWGCGQLSLEKSTFPIAIAAPVQLLTKILQQYIDPMSVFHLMSLLIFSKSLSCKLVPKGRRKGCEKRVNFKPSLHINRIGYACLPEVHVQY